MKKYLWNPKGNKSETIIIDSNILVYYRHRKNNIHTHAHTHTYKHKVADLFEQIYMCL